MHLSTLVTSLLGLSLAASASPLDKRTSRTSAPSGCLTVGSGGQYSTIGAALAALGSSAATACVYVAAGTYAEQLTITYNGNLTMYGETADTSSYHDNVVTIANTISSSQAGSLDLSATVNVRSNLFRMYNINVVNGYGQGAQAVALVANADQVGFYGCGFYGYQDTLYSKAGHQYYSNCYIEGAVDYIFGDASAWFGECDIVSNGGGAITAMSRASTTETTWYAIDNSNVYGKSGLSLEGQVYLGRPWRVDARVIYQNTALSNIINAAGWTTMAANATPLYYEYNNSGDGSSTSQRLYETPISAAVDKTTVLGSDCGNWIDRTY